MVDHGNLEQSAVIGVTAAILVVTSILSIIQLISLKLNSKYPTAQKFLILVHLFPVAIG